ncbi:MAG: hypothetical protein Q4A54_09785 [Parabacteroides sp.]|nr:hypothetical protein [Parabacteroides sp.]
MNSLYRAYYERAILYTHVGRYKEAIADNEILIKHNERLWSDALINKAEALYFMKEYGLALKSSNRYFEVEEQTESEAYKIRADMRMYKKKEKEEKKKKNISIVRNEEGLRMFKKMLLRYE